VLEILGLFGFGLTVGLYGTLVGIGGGPLLIPMLTIFYDLPPATVVATSISVVFLNALSGSIAYFEQRRTDLVSGTIFGIVTIPASVAAYFLLASISHKTFETGFAVFLLCMAAYLLARKTPTDLPAHDAESRTGILTRLSPRRVVDAQGNVFTFFIDEPLGGLINVVFGFVTSLLGIGGGILQVPALVFLLRMPVHVATATAHYITAVNAGFTLIPLLFFGHADPKLTLWLGVGAVLGARLGARFSIKFRGDTLLRMLAAALVVAGFWMLR
jgi:uncharacterized membrane protein YfcA